MMMIFHEHDEDPEMRPEPISPEKREEVIAHMAAGLLGAYRYFRANRRSVRVPARAIYGATPPRSGGTTRARAARGRSTRNAAAG